MVEMKRSAYINCSNCKYMVTYTRKDIDKDGLIGDRLLKICAKKHVICEFGQHICSHFEEGKSECPKKLWKVTIKCTLYADVEAKTIEEAEEIVSNSMDMEDFSGEDYDIYNIEEVKE